VAVIEKLVNLLFEEVLDEISTFLTSSKIDLSLFIFLVSDLTMNLNLYKLGHFEDSDNCFSNLS
jgi:hypothetical protein